MKRNDPAKPRGGGSPPVCGGGGASDRRTSRENFAQKKIYLFHLFSHEAKLRDSSRPAGAKDWVYMVVDNATNYWLYVVGSEWGPQLSRMADGKWKYMKGENE